MPPFIRPPGGPISRIIMPLVLLIAVLIIICTSLKDMMVWIDATLRRIGTTSITVLGVFIIGTVLHIALQTTPPVSSAEADIWDWIDKSGLRQYNKVFGEQGVQTRKDLLSNELENWIPEFSTLPPDKQYELRYAFSALKEEYYLQILLQKNNIPSTIVDRLKFRGVVSLVALSHLSDNVIQVVTEADSTLTDFKNLKHCVRHATDYIDHREELDLYSQVGKDFDSPLTPLAMKALKIGRLPDGLTRRGDVNLLMLGDPGTAKSQLLKFVERVSPIAVYTSGKGSSAAGLTASVIRDPSTRNFVMEGGAMVLADGGVVCIDEFDKMREDDRVAIHEAMEQQTISIAKAGITTTLNSRCSVLAAANSVYGRWDETKGEENIDFMPTILSRFDMIFIVKDEHNEERDMILAKHVMNVHLNSLQMSEEQSDGQINLLTLKKYISYCRTRCGPRLATEAAEKLKNRYVLMRNSASEYERETGKRITIPITVRQLEAIIRISESLAKMRMQPFATEVDVDEALRLFQVSTLDAAMSGNLSGVEGFTTEEDQELLSRIEKQIKRRFIIGSQVSEHAIIQDFTRQKYPERSIYKVLHFMMRRGEVQHRMQRKMLYRVK